MQNITFYARAAETLGEFTDYANAKTKPAPILTRGVAVCLQMRLFKEDGSLDPVPIDTFADVKAWQWVMDDDFDSTSNYILVAQHDQITVEAKTAEIEGESREITEFTIPIPEMNTEELDAVLQKKENVANLNGELVGLNGAGEAVYILQLKGFTVRNRISSAGNPTPITAEYYTAEQTRAIIAGTNAYELARKAEFHIGDRAYYPGEPGYLLVCVHDGTSAADLPELDKTVNVFLDGTVTWQVYDLSASGGGAANITVNDVSPDAEGNILLGAEDIAFSVKDEWENIIPTSGAISTVNLQSFFASMQYAIFSVNGHCAYVNSDNPEQVITDITIYGNTMFLESSGSESPIQDWDGNPLNTKTVYDLAVDVYTHSIKEISTDGGETYSTAENGKFVINCTPTGWVSYAMGETETGTAPLAHILDFLSRYSIYTINGMSVYDQDIGDINLTANDIPMRMVDDGTGNLYPDWTIGEAMDYKAGYPYFYSPETREINTEYYEDEPGYLIVRVSFASAAPEAPVTIEFNDNVIAKLQPGSAGEWQTFVIPSAYDRYIVRTPTPNVGTIWHIEVEFLIMNA